jgi:hypothetical protein
VILYPALNDSLAGSTRSAVSWWVLVGYWVVFVAWVTRRDARSLARAERAKSLARRTLNEGLR